MKRASGTCGWRAMGSVTFLSALCLILHLPDWKLTFNPLIKTMSPPSPSLISSVCYKSERSSSPPRLRLCLGQSHSSGLRWPAASLLFPTYRLGFQEMVSLRKSVSAVKCLLKPSPLFHTSHRAFVELVTYCMSVPRAGKRQAAPQPPYTPQPENSGATKCSALCASLQSIPLERSHLLVRVGRHGYVRQTYISIFLKQQTGGRSLGS